jgi:hypothetical protein
MRLATGRDGDGKSDRSRGDSTIRFFEEYGIETQRGLLQLVRLPTRPGQPFSRQTRNKKRS